MRRTQEKPEKKVNFWKYAFIGLMVLIVLLVGTVFYQATRPLNDARELTPVSQVDKKRDPVFKVTLTKKQAERIANHYINQYLNSKDIKYRLRFDKDISLLGSASFLGSEINFRLLTDPYATDKGGVQLKAQRLQIGRLGIPLEFVLFYIQGNYKFPKWVNIDSHKKNININLQDYHNSQGYYFKVQKLDLKNDKIVVNVYSSKY